MYGYNHRESTTRTAGVADAVEVAVGLVGVGDVRAVVERAEDAVAVRVICATTAIV